jgi:anti-sigma B factor antagonist
MREDSRFRAEVFRSGELTDLIEVHGEASISSAPDFKELLLKRIEGDATTVVVDLSGASMTDNAVLGTLIGSARLARSRCIRLHVVSADREIAHVFRISGLDQIISVFGSREEAEQSECGAGRLTDAEFAASTARWPLADSA